MNIRMKMIRAVNLEVDTDEFYGKSAEFGGLAAKSLGSERRAQITGLENIANSSQKVSDVLDYIKLRTGRDQQSRDPSKPGWHQNNLGKKLIAFIEKDLRTKRDHICQSSPDFASLDVFQHQEIYMLLIRSLVSQIAAQYEFIR